VRIGVKVEKEVGAEVGIATAKEIRKAGLVIKGFKGFKVKIIFFLANLEL
jgi:hypothetical protein